MAQVTYRGTTFTTSGSPRLKSVDGLDGWSGLGGPFPQAFEHGAVPGPILAAGKEFQLVFQLIGSDSSSNWTQRSQVRSVFNPADATEDVLTVEWDGWPAMQIACKPLNRQGDMGAHSPLIPVRLVASDPVLYSTTLRSTVVPVFVGSGGLTYPVTYPKDYGSAGSGLSTLVLNDGEWDTWPRFTISGPSSGTVSPLRIENVTTGENIVFSGLTIPSGSTLVVETHPLRRSVQFTDGASRWNTVPNTEWWPIHAGGAQLRFRASGTTTGVTCTCETRDAWL